MKNIIPILTIIILMASCANKLTKGRFAAIEPWKEWEIELKLNKDSTFTLEDRFGCNVFNYRGRWYYHKDIAVAFIVLNDTIKSHYIKSHDMYQFFNTKTQKQQMIQANEYFPVISTDTVLIFEKNKMLTFRGLTFKKQKLFSNKDLAERRFKIIEKYYFDKMGKEFFIKAFGNGKGIKEAKKNILNCKSVEVQSIWGIK